MSERNDNLNLFLACLEELMADMPQMRFGQVLSNLDTWIRARTSIDLFYIPDEALIAEMERMNVTRWDYAPTLEGWDVT